MRSSTASGTRRCASSSTADTEHEPLTLHYFVWLIMGGPRPGTGRHGVPRRRRAGARIKNYVSPGEVVERFGVKASDVPLCLISHLHYRSLGRHALFPNAQFWNQKDEVAFWTGRHAGTPALRVRGCTLAREPRDAQLPGPHQDHRRRPRGVAQHPCPQGGRPRRRPSDRERRDRARPGDPRVRCLALLPRRSRTASPSRSSPTSPRCSTPSRPSTSSRARTPGRRRPRPRGGHAVQGGEAGGGQDRLTGDAEVLRRVRRVFRNSTSSSQTRRAAPAAPNGRRRRSGGSRACGCRRSLHALERAGALVGAPIALAGDEHRRHLDRPAGEQLQLGSSRPPVRPRYHCSPPWKPVR